MTSNTQSILCGTRRIPTERPSDGKDQNVFTCPSCGRSDTRENVLNEVKSLVTELAQRSLQETMRKSLGGSKFIKVDSKPIPKKTYRFITDHKF